jgi:hypothetical protein
VVVLCATKNQKQMAGLHTASIGFRFFKKVVALGGLPSIFKSNEAELS